MNKAPTVHDVKAAFQCLARLQDLVFPLHGYSREAYDENMETVGRYLRAAGFGPRKIPKLTRHQMALLRKAADGGYRVKNGTNQTRTHQVLKDRGFVYATSHPDMMRITAEGKYALRTCGKVVDEP